jgi:signal transduction histidine kinase
MKTPLQSVRVRLTVWYVSVLAGIILAFSGGVYFFLRHSLYTQLDGQLSANSAVLEELASAGEIEDAEDLREIEQEKLMEYFHLRKAGQSPYQSQAWRENGRDAGDREAADLSTLVRESVECLQVLADEKNQKISQNLHPGMTAAVNRLMLRQAVINLLDNAIKYSPVGGAITVSVKPGPAAEAGTGLGLAIARQTVESHGGRIEVTEGKNGGSIFRIII